MGFRKLETNISGLIVIEPDVFTDSRGYFMETYNQQAFEKLGFHERFVQDNLSYGTKGVLRGLHFQAPPFAQGKLVSVISGEVQDVVVDIRKNSPTYGENFEIILSAENKKMLYVPPGFAHGFLTLSENCIFIYKCTDFYNKEAEGGLIWNDPELKIKWLHTHPVLSPKDLVFQSFSSFQTQF